MEKTSVFKKLKGIVTKRRFWACFFLILTLLITFFIFSNSAKDAESSAEQSGKVVDAVEDVCDSVGIETERKSLEQTVRTAAHFLEYCALGATMAAGLLLLNKKGKKQTCISFLLSLLYAFCIASADEFVIQRSSVGRVADWADIATDLLGALCGLAFAAAVMGSSRLAKRKKNSKQV